jgi:Cu+-exporting ATPase
VRKHLTRSRDGGGGSSSETAAFEIDDPISRAVFQVLGMTCSACAGSVEKAIKRLPGIHDAVIDALNNRAQILFYPNSVDVSYDILSNLG